MGPRSRPSGGGRGGGGGGGGGGGKVGVDAVERGEEALAGRVGLPGGPGAWTRPRGRGGRARPGVTDGPI
jgi:hypothetical protein